MKKGLKIAGILLLNIILVIIAVYLLKWLLVPAIICTGVISFFNRKVGNGFKNINHYFRTVAMSVDQLGNVVCADLLNVTLIKFKKEESYKFGNPDETVSGVLGKNQKLKTLTVTGKILNSILNLIEKDHSIKAIEEDENN